MSTATQEPLRIIEQAKSEAVRRIEDHEAYYREVTGWMSSSVNEAAAEKALPYYDFDSYRQTIRLGSRLFHESMLGRTIHENLLSYLVGTGHSYSVERLDTDADGNKEDATTALAMKAIDEFLSFYEWPDMQEEFYNRWFRSGDTIRIVQPLGRTVEFAYVEPFNLAPPDNRKAETAPFGIEYRNGNVNSPVRYYLVDATGKPKAVDRITRSQVVSHGKRGVDRNDPRGIPLLWLAYCPAREIDELDRALSKILAATSEHAVVYDYNPDVTNAAITRVADGATVNARTAAAKGRMANNPGGAVHARDYKVVLNGAGVNGSDWVEVLQGKRRTIGVLAGLPEFIVTGDAETGSRNTLFVAEAPFTRRISREARRGSAHEVEVLYHAIASSFGKFGDEAWLLQFKSNYRIVAKFALAESQDKAAETARIMNLLDKKVISPQVAARMIGEDYDQVQADWDAHLEREEQRRESIGSFVALDAEDIRVRAEVAQTLIGRGIDPAQALTYVGLDPVEHATLVVPRLPAPAPVPGDPALSDSNAA